MAPESLRLAPSLDGPPPLEALLARHLPAMRAFVRARVSRALISRESSSDIVQSACRDALRHWSRFQYRDEESFRRWLTTVALNKIRQRERFLRACKRDIGRELTDEGGGELELLAAGSGSPSEEAMMGELLERLGRALDRLPAIEREVIVLSRIQGLPHAEVAHEIGRSELAARSLLSRALVRLSRYLAEGAAPTGGVPATT
ncbi:MAG: sigma-70 family RNA polymerase sigma factor [Planctomycetota bacterium]